MNRTARLAALLALAFAPVLRAEPLPADDRNVTGKFDNGVSYIVRPHNNPPGRVWMYLHVKTGALNESDAQNGLAHFLEHMAFNGTKNFAPGKLIETLNALGMQFGADTNAHTAWTETVYKLNLPDNKPETVALGLKVFGDYADGMLLEAHEVDEERGVIAGEKRSGKGAQERIQKQTIKELFPDTHLAKHDVIGEDDVIAKADRELFVDYYNTYYRPENMTLIVVGDIKPDEIVAPARAALGSFKSRAEARKATAAGLKPSDKAGVSVITDDEQVRGEVGMVALTAGRPPVTTYEQQKREMTDDIGQWIMNRRLSELVRKGQAKYQGATAGSFDFVHEVTVSSVDAGGEPKDWEAMLTQAIVETHRAVEHGFTKRELELAKAEFIENAERAVQTESTQDAGGLIVSISSSVDDENTFTSAATDLAVTKRVFEEVDLKQVNAAFAETFGVKNYHYTVVLPSKPDGTSVPDKAAVMTAAEKAWTIPAEAPAEAAVASTLLEKAPTPGTVNETTAEESLGVTTLTFANHVVVHHKFSDFKKDSVLIRITLPGGKLDETAATAGLTEAGALLLDQPATGRLDSTQVRDLFVGKSVNVGGSAGFDTIGFSVNGAPKDLASGLELVHALITDGRLEQSALEEWKKAEIQQAEQRRKTAEGRLGESLSRVFLGNDPRLAPLPAGRLTEITREAAESRIRKLLGESPIEVAIVGDIKLDDAKDLAAKFLGSLNERPELKTVSIADRKLERSAGPWQDSVSFDTVTPKAIVFAGYRGVDDGNVQDIRRLNLAAIIVGDRMNTRIREKEQLVYSIDATSSVGRNAAGTGMYFAAAPTDPKNADKLADTVLEMLKQFGTDGPTEAELSMARKQIATQLMTQMKQPGFWLGQLAEFQLRGRKFSDLKELPDAYQKYTGDEIRDVSNKYTTDDAAIRFVVIPTATTSAPTTAPAGQ